MCKEDSYLEDLMEEELARDRTIRLFTFLRQLSELRTKTVRSLESYENVLDAFLCLDK